MNLVKYLFFLILFQIGGLSYLSAQTMNYTALWKKVDEYTRKDLPKSALAEVKKIYTLARKEGQDGQLLKALVYMNQLQQETREDNEILSLSEMEKELAAAKEPARSILHSILGGLYEQYLEEHRWELYDRTNTVNFDKSDLTTWTADDLHKKISYHYLQSLKEKAILIQTRPDRYDPVIDKGNTRLLRPTLYDLLAHRALGYFVNDERDIKKPAYAFEISQPEAFAPAARFARFAFTTRDTFSLQHKALQIYQELIKLHLGDAKPDALIDVDISRISFVHRNSVADNKDSLYLDALQALVQQYPGQPGTKQARYLIAAWKENKANSYDPFKDTSTRFLRMEAREILQSIVNDSALKNEGWVNSYNLLQQIDQRSFSFELEEVNLPSQPFRVRVQYRNISNLHLRLIPWTESLKKTRIKADDDAWWAALVAAKPIRSWQQKLPDTRDLQDHGVEIKIDALPSGRYMLIASAEAHFTKSKTPVGFSDFYVSPISFIRQEEQFFVLHRETGQPLAGAIATVYNQQYDYKTSSYIRNKLGTYQTDNHGYFILPTTKDQRDRNYFVDLKHGQEELNMDEPIYAYYRYPDDRARTIPNRIFFFTDRAIYRPGQTVIFKGIMVRGEKKSQSVVTAMKSTVYLRNVQYEVIDSLELTTNEFGSFNGQFVLPQGGLNGQYWITAKDDENRAGFSVEEYKRPRFSVQFEKITESYSVDDTVTVVGQAKAYAGNDISGAKVSYRVVRRPRFIYRWFARSWMPPSEPMEITHGIITTGTDGKFTIRFKAIPDKKINPDFNPLFDYVVQADVSDINGETRSGSKTVTAGYSPIVLKLEVPEKLILDSGLKQISIRTENLNGEFQPAVVELNISSLQPEGRLIRSRYWERPDQFVFSKEEYIRLFPHDEYSNETDPQSWPRKPAFNRQVQTSENKTPVLEEQNLQPGYYIIEARFRDSAGREVKDERIVEIYDPRSDAFVKPEYLWNKGTEGPVEPGGTATVRVGSFAQAVFLVQQTDKEGRPDGVLPGRRNPSPLPETGDPENRFRFVSLNREKKTFSFPVTEEDRGGFGLGFFFVKDNRFFQFQDVVRVPWSNKELNISYTSSRDKTLPGSQEKWTVKISGSKNEQVAAEVLAGMYDASLDQFRAHEWNKPNLWPVYSGYLSWEHRHHFSDVDAEVRQPELRSKNFNKRYDWFIFDRNRYGDISDRFMGRTAGVVMRNGNYSQMRDTKAENLQMSVSAPPSVKRNEEVMTDSVSTIGDSNHTRTDDKENSVSSDPGPRKNFRETAFFFPELRTNANGDIEFSFTAPEALTKWKLQTLAHTKDLAFGLTSRDMVTQKELMVQPNVPRFLRQGDRMELSSKIVNLTDNELTGQAQLELIDAVTNQPVDGWFMNTFPNQFFTVAAGQSVAVQFPVQTPFQFNSALKWRITARTNPEKGSPSWTDAEEDAFPVLSNKILVTETMPLAMRGSGTKNFNFQKLQTSASSTTLQHQSLTVEFTSNPAWLVVQALPYLMEYPYDCAEQVWNRYYANALASRIVQSTPRIRAVFERWQNMDSSALLSALQKNPELKSALLEETPWVLEAKNEATQKKNIALLFDLVRMNSEQASQYEKLKQMQSENGGFVWFKGGPDNRYITQYILTGIGHLKKLGVSTDRLNPIIKLAIPYLDKKISEDYDNLVKQKVDLSKDQLSSIQVQYLYMRSFFPEIAQAAANQKALTFFTRQEEQFWTKRGKQEQGMIALTLHRKGNNAVPAAILRSLKETAINSEELGMYWKENVYGRSWFWWHAPIETQSLLIEAFNEAGKDTKTVDDLRTWLLKNKQTNNWRTTKATADACYALMLQGSNWLEAEPVVNIKLGGTEIGNQRDNTEAGTGYFKQAIEGRQVKPEMGNMAVRVEMPGGQNIPSWGAVYWQYFEDMDKVTTASTPLKLVKKLFVEKNTDRGPVLTPVAEGQELHVGDKIKVRIELRVDRDMEYVHMKDLRAAGLEPVNVLSGYRWQGFLGYYESTKDLSTQFFFDYLRKGTHVFEYPLFVTHKGNFTNGITSIQCMYAPEFSAHSEGGRLVVE
jgi:hypothetical protein